jgi:hypothetical protein
VSPRYIVHSYNLPSTSIKFPVAEKGVDIGMLSETEFKKHLHEKESARLAANEDDRDIFDLDKDGRPLDGKLYRDEVVVNFLQNHLSNTINKSEAFRGVINDWYEESISFYQDLKNLPCSRLDDDYEEKVLELLERSNDAIKVLVDTLHHNKGAVHFRDLFSILIATSLWPQRLTYHKKIRNGALTKTQFLFQNLVQRLDEMSMDRISNFSRLPTKNPHFMKDPWKRLVMAKAWMHVLTNDLGGKVHGFIYPYNLLYKVAQDNGEKSRRFFSKFDPATMVDLAKVLLRLRYVPEDFHKYYALFKFYEFINCFSLEEIALICQAFQSHGIKVLGDHPLNSALQTVVLNRLCDSMETVDDIVFTIIDDFFRLKSLNNFNRFEEFQEKAINCPNLGLSTLIRVLRRSDSTVCALNEDLIQKITDLILNDINTIAFVDCLLLQRLITRNVFTNEIAFKLNTRLLKLMEEKDKRHLAEEKSVVLPFILLQFAYQGFFSEVLCNQLKNDERLFAKIDDKKVELKNNILRGELKEQRSIRAAIGIIDGLGKYHGKDLLDISG